MTLHTYTPQPMSLPIINFLHLMVSEIEPRQNFRQSPAHPNAHPDTMGKINILTTGRNKLTYYYYFFCLFISKISWAIGVHVSSEWPPMDLDPDGKAMNQPRPHSSNRIV